MPEPWELNEADSFKFAEALGCPQEPNEALKAAAERYKSVKTPTMKLFIWNEPHSVPYGSSMLIAMAHTEDEAREIASKSPGYIYGEFDHGIGEAAKLGAPTRVIEGPCAEWHTWSE
jgi:hypothetical protein